MLYSVVHVHVGPAYFVVKFRVDDTISMIPRKNIVGTTVPAVDDCCEVKWSSGEVLTATVLAAGKCVPPAKKSCAKVLTSTENLKRIEQREKKEKR